MPRSRPSITVGSCATGRRRRSRLLRGCVALTAAAVCLALAGSAPLARKKPAGSLVWLPAPGSQKTPDPRLKMHGTRATFRQSGIVLQLELLDDHNRRLFLASAGITSADPFAASTFGRHTWTFLLRLENTADEPLTFRPPAVSLYTKKPLSVTSPCDYLCLLEAAEKAALDKAEEKILLSAALDSAETLRAGDRVSKLLVFVDVPHTFKQFVLDLDGFVIGRNVLHFVLPYRAEKMDRAKSSASESRAANSTGPGAP